MAQSRKKQEEFQKWLREHEARHAEWARLAAENDARIEAEMDAKCPASEGWHKINRSVRIRFKGTPLPLLYGDGI